MALFTITVAAQAKEREGVISLALLRASLSDSITRKVGPIAARQLTPILGKIEDAGHWKRGVSNGTHVRLWRMRADVNQGMRSCC